MTTCVQCGSNIVFGGVIEGTMRFCNEECHRQSILQRAGRFIPEDMLAGEVERVHKGNCPRCGGAGPVDIHEYHTVWSAIVITRYGSRSLLCCQSCGTKSKLGSAFSSMVLGWWGFPFGLIITPVQIVRNLAGFFNSPDPMVPSGQLVHLIRGQIASQIRPAGSQASPIQATQGPTQ